MLTRSEFMDALRTGLMQLDDLTSLRRSPLLPVLCAPDAGPLVLQQALVAAIAEVALMDDPFAAEAHEILYYRYVERMTQQQLAYQQGVSVRHLRRLQENALELLTARLLQQLERPPAAEKAPVSSAVAEEVAWLRSGPIADTADLDEELRRALHDVDVVARHYQVEVNPPPPLPETWVVVPPPVLHQTLLTALAWAVARCHDGRAARVTVNWLGRGSEAGVVLSLSEAPAEQEMAASDLAVAGQLLASFGGRMALRSERGLHVEIWAPREAGLPVLVVDDNPDARLLFQRHLAKSRFQPVLASDAQVVVELAQQHHVAAIVLDIMMPGVDGWSLLAQLRHHPETQAIPVVICSILPQRPLADLLGAAAFLQKPVSQEDLRATLARVTAPAATTPG